MDRIMTLIRESNLSLAKQFEQSIILDNWVRHYYIWVVKQAAHHLMTLPLTTSSNFKLKTSLIGFRISCYDTCNSMEHAHPSYAHIVLQMSHALGQV